MTATFDELAEQKYQELKHVYNVLLAVYPESEARPSFVKSMREEQDKHILDSNGVRSCDLFVTDSDRGAAFQARKRFINELSAAS